MDWSRDGLAVRTLGKPGLAWRGVALEHALTKPAAVAYVLALRGAPVPKSELIELLWGAGRGANLRTALYALRKHAHADAWLREAPDGRALTIAAAVDLKAFERAMAEGDAGAALAVLPQGCADGGLPRLLDGFEVPAAPAFEEWLEVERARVGALLRECLSMHARQRAAAGAYDEARARLKGVLAADPYDEASHRALMEVLAVQGDVEGALRQYEACRRLLADELGVAPVADTTETYERIRAGRRPAVPVAAPRAEQRGHAVEFVGRERELAELDEALAASRLVTILGSGGVGKTRLALEATRRLPFARERATHVVPLGSLRSSAFVVAAVANALRIGFDGADPHTEQLAAALRRAPSLIVLDEAEHLDDLDEVLAPLLELAPTASFLLTSRRALGLPAERVLRLRGMTTAAADGGDPAGVSDAARLFVTAVRSIDPEVDPDSAVTRAIVDTLRGHPLAIVLAAGWLRFQDGPGLLRTLRDDLLALENPGLDVDSRHASLRRVMASSWERLTPHERRVMMRLSLIGGSFEAPAATALAGADARSLLDLVGKSLLQAAPQGAYAMHPMVRAFAREQLRTSELEADEVADTFARTYLDRLADARTELLGPDPAPTLERLDREFDDLREAWRHAARQRPATSLTEAMRASVEPFSLYADMRVRFAEAIQVFADAADVQARMPEADVELQADLRVGLGTHLFRSSRFDEALAALDAAANAAPESALRVATRHRLVTLRGHVLVALGRYAPAEEAYRNALAIARSGLPDVLGRDLRALGNVAMIGGRREEAEARYREAVAQHRAQGYLIGTAIDLNNLAELLIQSERLEEAEAAIAEGLRIAAGTDVHLVPYLKLNVAEAALRRRNAPEAEAAAREADALARRYGQIALQSRAATAFARVALLRGHVDDARERLGDAVRTAREGREPAALVHALRWMADWADARGDARLALRAARVVVGHPAGEAVDREAMRARLAGDGVGDQLGETSVGESELARLVAELEAEASSGRPAHSEPATSEP